MEEDHFVDPVQELRPEVRAHHVHHLAPHAFGDRVVRVALGQEVAAKIRRHDDDRVLEVHRPALRVGQPAVVEQLQHDVEDLGVGLLDLVEEDHRVRTPPHGLGELACLIVTHVPRRRTHQPGDGVFLLVFRHVDSDQRMLVVEQELGERTRHLRLAHAGRAQEQEAAQRPVRILQARARAPDCVGHRRHRLVLPDHAQVQPLLHAQELLDLAFHQLADGDVRPPADDGGDVFLVDLFLQHPGAGGEVRLAHLDFLFELRQPAVLQLRRLGVVAGPLRPLDLEPQGFELFLELARLLDRVLFLFPLRLQTGRDSP